jgi:hypothetical protein
MLHPSFDLKVLYTLLSYRVNDLFTNKKAITKMVSRAELYNVLRMSTTTFTNDLSSMNLIDLVLKEINMHSYEDFLFYMNFNYVKPTLMKYLYAEMYPLKERFNLMVDVANFMIINTTNYFINNKKIYERLFYNLDHINETSLDVSSDMIRRLLQYGIVERVIIK